LTVEIVTFGCRLNLAETEVLRRHATAAGVTDAVVVNTCAVTAEAERQARQAIRRARRERPAAAIVATGCAVQTAPDAFAAIEAADHVLGNRDKLAASTWHALAAGTLPRRAVSDVFDETALAPHGIDPRELPAHTRAFVQVQNGCDHRCTFCTIPFGRGRARSLPVEAAVTEVRRVVEAGAREVVLTGVDLTSWGTDLSGEPRLGSLVRAILAAVPELARLRLSSIDQVEADPDLLDALAEEPRLMPHLHLSLQSGDDLILKRMKRRHRATEAERFCATVRRLRPDIVFGADVIAGFPTETEDAFRRSLDMVERCGLSMLHVFPYSPRPRTPAARMPQTAPALVAERAARLRAEGARAFRAHLDARVGTRDVVLTERGGVGRIEGFTRARLTVPLAPNRLLPVRLTGHDGTAFLADAA